MKINTFFLVLLFSASIFCEGISIDEYIKSAKKDSRLKIKKEAVETFDSAGDTPWIKNLEFRSETGNFDIKEQTYGLRLYFKGFGETKYSRELIKNTQNLHKLDYRIEYQNILFERYNTILLYIHHKKEAEILDLMKQILEDKLTVTEKISQITAEKTEVDIMDAEDEIYDNEMQKSDLEYEIRSIEKTIKYDTNSDEAPLFDREKIISLEEIAVFADSAASEQAKLKTASEYQNLQMAVAQSEIALEEAKSNDWLKFISLEYDTGHREDKPSRGFSIGFAISIPVFKNNQNSLLKKQSRSLNESFDFYEEQRLREIEIETIASTLKQDIKQHEILSEKRNRAENSGLLEKYSSSDGVNPLIVLKLKERILRQSVKILDLELKIYMKYIRLNYLMENFTHESEQNFLYSANIQR